MAGSIDTTTKVNLGILGTLVAMAAAGAFYFGGLKATAVSVDQSLKSMRAALDRNTMEIQKGNTLDAVFDSRVNELERRVTEIEREKK